MLLMMKVKWFVVLLSWLWLKMNCVGVFGFLCRVSIGVGSELLWL